MPRQRRIEYPGATYHVMARGNRREPIFLDDADCERFLDSLGKACEMTGWEVRAFVLMGNHYHLVVHTPKANLVEGMKWLQNAYTRYFNTRHRLWGRLFGDRYKSILVEESHSFGGKSHARPDYLASLLNYVHLNPARAKMVDPGRGESLLDYRWSSVALGYAVAPSKRPGWLEVATGLELAQCRDTAAGRRRYVEQLDQRALAESLHASGMSEAEIEGQTLNSTLRRGWYWGSEVFREWLLEQLGRESPTTDRAYVSGPQGRDHGEAMAERILERGREELGFETREELAIRRRGDLRQVAIAWAIWRFTSGVSQKWIAEALGLKSAANASQLIRRFEQEPEKKLPPKIREWKTKMSKNAA